MAKHVQPKAAKKAVKNRPKKVLYFNLFLIRTPPGHFLSLQTDPFPMLFLEPKI